MPLPGRSIIVVVCSSLPYAGPPKLLLPLPRQIDPCGLEVRLERLDLTSSA